MKLLTTAFALLVSQAAMAGGSGASDTPADPRKAAADSQTQPAARTENRAASEEGSARVVETMLTSEGRFISDFNVSYLSITSSSGIPLTSIPGAGGTNIPIPVSIGDIEQDEDLVIPQLRLRYGVTDKLEIFGFASAFADFQRLQFSAAGMSQTDSDSTYDFNTAGLGATYALFEETKYPSLFISASTNVLDNTNFSIADTANAGDDGNGAGAINEAIRDAILGDDYDVNYFKSVTLSLTSYYSVDPVVFLVQGGVTQNFERESGDRSIDLGNVYSLKPQAIFVVSPFITLSGGVEFAALAPAEINGEEVSATRTILGPTFGLSYQPTDAFFLSFSAGFIDEADFSSANANLGFTYRFN